MRILCRQLVLSLLFSTSAVMAAESLCPAQSKSSGIRWERTEGPDFDVCRAFSVSSSKELFGLYLGNHPSFKPSSALAVEKSRIGKTDVTWYTNATETPKVISRETLVRLPNKEFPQFAHIWFSVSGQPELQQRLKQIEELNLGL